MGFNNTARLRGGIVSYARELQRLNSDDDDDAYRGGDDDNDDSGDGLDQQHDDVELEIIEPHQVVVGGGDASIYSQSDSDRHKDSSSYNKNEGVINDSSDDSSNDSRSIDKSKGIDTDHPPPSPHHHHHQQQSMFRGVNYVFDERIGSRVTEDVLRRCEQCDGVSDDYNNCLNYDCNVS